MCLRQACGLNDLQALPRRLHHEIEIPLTEPCGATALLTGLVRF
jgi:hypothetical protein